MPNTIPAPTHRGRGASRHGVEVRPPDEPELNGPSRERCPLLIVGQLDQAEALEQQPQMGLDGRYGQAQLVGYLLVRGWGGELVAVAEGTAERDEHLLLRRRGLGCGADVRRRGGAPMRPPVGLAEDEDSVAYRDLIAVSE